MQRGYIDFSPCAEELLQMYRSTEIRIAWTNVWKAWPHVTKAHLGHWEFDGVAKVSDDPAVFSAHFHDEDHPTQECRDIQSVLGEELLSMARLS